MLGQLYYWMYHYLTKVKTNDQPFFNAYLGITFFFCLNITAVGRTLYHFKLISSDKEGASLLGIVMYLFVSIPLFFHLFQRRKLILDTINRYSIQKLKMSKVYFWAYIFTSLTLMYLVLQYT